MYSILRTSQTLRSSRHRIFNMALCVNRNAMLRVSKALHYSVVSPPHTHIRSTSVRNCSRLVGTTAQHWYHCVFRVLIFPAIVHLITTSDVTIGQKIQPHCRQQANQYFTCGLVGRCASLPTGSPGSIMPSALNKVYTIATD